MGGVEQDATARALAVSGAPFHGSIASFGLRRTATAGRNAVAGFDAWITTAKACDFLAVATFASGLDSDSTMVRATLTNSFSTGQTEGQINRLKLIKRQS